MNGHAHTLAHTGTGLLFLDLALWALAAIAVWSYAGAVIASRRRGRTWPLPRLLAWCAGVGAALASVTGPLAEAAHSSFVAHMTAHLVGGMLAPLLLVLAAPVTLALRTLAVTPARRVSRMLRSAPVRWVSHPIVAAALSVGGLWIIYLTPAFAFMQSGPLGHVVVHAHLLLAGYVFTASVIGLDPSPHAPPRAVTATALVLAMAGHGMLAKHLYANPPAGFALADVQSGAQLMYYGGAWIEAAIIVVFCARWYRAAGRRLDLGETVGQA